MYILQTVNTLGGKEGGNIQRYYQYFMLRPRMLTKPYQTLSYTPVLMPNPAHSHVRHSAIMWELIFCLIHSIQQTKNTYCTLHRLVNSVVESLVKQI